MGNIESETGRNGKVNNHCFSVPAGVPARHGRRKRAKMEILARLPDFKIRINEKEAYSS